VIDNKPIDKYTGRRFTVVHCRGALKSFEAAIARVKPTKKRATMTAFMISQITRLADGETMSERSFRKEAALPRRKGQQKLDYFYALKRIPIRGYCWKSHRVLNTYFISHYIYKDFDDLHDSDTEIVTNNWRRIEEGNDEC